MHRTFLLKSVLPTVAGVLLGSAYSDSANAQGLVVSAVWGQQAALWGRRNQNTAWNTAWGRRNQNTAVDSADARGNHWGNDWGRRNQNTAVEATDARGNDWGNDWGRRNQNTAVDSGRSKRETKPDSSNSQRPTFFSRYPWNGVNMWAGGSIQTRNASHNEIIDGQLRVVAFQLTRDVMRSQRFRLAYVGEVLPIMLAHSGAPLNRKPNVKANPALLNDPARLALYEYHDSYGFGIAPFGAEFTTRLSERMSFLLNTTAGGALFSKVVPYGDATKAVFTVSPGAALQWEVFHRTAVAFGYTFHHLSNASLGQSNPGMNSQIIYARIARMGSRF